MPPRETQIDDRGGLRVLYTFPHVLGRPGIATTARQQILSVVAQGCRVEVWCAANWTRMPESVHVVETMCLAGQRIPHRVLGVDRAYRLHDRRVARRLSQRPDVDVVHAWPGSLHTLTAARRLGVAAVREVPNTHTAHAVEQVALENQLLHLAAPRGHSHTASAAALAREELEYRAATRLLVPSDYVAKTFAERGYAPERWVRHRYGFDPQVFTPPVEGLHSAGARPFTAVFAGSCEPRKGLHYAVQAWHESGASSSGRLLIAGKFLPGYAEAIGKQLHHPSIECLGFAANLSDLLRTADVLLLPSVEEGSALVIYEAMGAGCVPVVSDVAGAPCQQGIDALIHPARNVATLSAHLRSLVEDADLLARLRKRTLVSAPGLTWESGGEVLVGAYHTAMDDVSRW